MTHQHIVPELVVGLSKSFGIILASEIGDKTFFIAAVMAMRSPRFTVFASALAALAAMTVLSVAMGWAAPNLIPKAYTHYAATALFFFFGLKSLYDATFKHHDEGEQSELEQVEQEIAAGKSDSKLKERDTAPGSPLSTLKEKPRPALHMRMLSMVFSQIFIKCFTLTFLAEWGDRSQISTIGLAAQEDPVGVAIGGVLGHMVCTGAAVMGGRHLAAHINERTVAVCGGILFLLFGAHALYTGPE